MDFQGLFRGTDHDLSRFRGTTLATDLDGTLIPLSHQPENSLHLQELTDFIRQAQMTLVFVTGRHFESVLSAIHEYELPKPQWILCDVGTSAWERTSNGSFVAVDRYAEVMRSLMRDVDQQFLLSLADAVTHLRRQPPRNQSPFKTSFFAPAEHVGEVLTAIRAQLERAGAVCQIISSIDPITGEGLIDLLPDGASKAFALDWWCKEHKLDRQSVIFAGDSGNDLEAVCAGYKSILVGNAAPRVIDSARSTHAKAGWNDRLFLAERHATSGVLEGLLHFTTAATDSSS